MPSVNSYQPSKRFLTSPTSEGYEVIDMRDGRPVTGSFPIEQAILVAGSLNAAAGKGRRFLARALGCIDDDKVVECIGETVMAFDYA